MTTDLPPEARSWLADIDHALRNGSRMTRANLSFELLCGALGVDAEELSPSREDLPADLRIKAITETAARLGRELGKAEGRKQAGEEIAQAIESQVGDGEWASDYYRKAARIARSITSQPQEGTPEPLTAPGGHSDLPEVPEAALRACGCTFETNHNYGCPTGGGRIDSIRIPGSEG